MHAHVRAMEEARRAAVFGDSVSLRWAVRAIYTRGSVEGIPADARPWLADLRRAARAVATESDLTEAVRGTALLARHCGGCHREVGAVATGWPPETPRPDLDGPRAHARGADWALGRLWDGVVHPSEAAWEAGREVLGDPRTFQGGPLDRRMEREGARAPVRRLEGMAWVAARSGDLDERARVLGDVMVTCADCHTTVRGGGL